MYVAVQTPKPSVLSTDIKTDATHQFVTSAQITKWDTPSSGGGADPVSLRSLQLRNYMGVYR